MIPYAPGRSPAKQRLIDRLNANEVVIPITPQEIFDMGEIVTVYAALLQSQKATPNLPAGFIGYKLGAPATQTPILGTAIVWKGTISEIGTAAPTTNETTATGLVISTARTSAGFYTLTGFPTGYTIVAHVEPINIDKAVTCAVAGQTITVKSYDGGVIGDALLTANPMLIVLT